MITHLNTCATFSSGNTSTVNQGRWKQMSVIDSRLPIHVHRVELALRCIKLAFVVAILSVFVLPAFGILANVTWDATYGNPDGSIDSVSCSNGLNGLLTKGYTTFSSLPSFPNIGGVPGNTWNSTLCGSCWGLKYTAPSGGQTTVYITAVDDSYTFNISPQAFDALTNGTGFAAGKVEVRAIQVSASQCGM